MKDDLSIGLLLPASSVLPMGKDFERGLKKGLKDIEGVDVDISSEYVANGDLKRVEEACSRFINYDQVDIAAGILNNRALVHIAPKFDNKKTLLIANSLGEVWPALSELNPNVLLNSMGSWRIVWSLSNWATQQFGKKGMYVAGTFDSGFSFSAALDHAMLKNGEDTLWSFAIAPAPQAQNGELAEVGEVIQPIIETEPDFVLAAFCGAEAIEFLRLFKAHGLDKKTKLICLPYLLEDMNDNEFESLEIYTARVAAEKSELRNPLSWKSDFKQLGYETGLAIHQAIGENDDFKTKLQAKSINSTRGKISFVHKNYTELGVVLSQVEWNGSIDKSKVLRYETIDSIDTANAEIQELALQKSSGWFNPYLGV